MAEYLTALTRRERAILRLLAEDATDREIARRLDLAYGTVKWYNKRLYARLRVGNRREAVNRARALGLLDNGPSDHRHPTPQHNLPAPLTPFVGRERELGLVAELLCTPTVRLLTILGLGGMGKTRLALAAAAVQRPYFPHGVYLVELRPRQSESPLAHLGGALAHTFKLACDGDQPPQQLVTFLQDKALLLVLDNAEYGLDGIGLVSDLLTHGPQVKMLVTSRERLNLRGETVLRLDGLDVPPATNGGAGLEFGAVRLFQQTAQRLKHDFQVTAVNEAAVTRICQLVDGMPLALELAAAWVNVLTPAEIAREIAHDLDFLATASDDVPPRLSSVRAVFESSWARLTEADRQMCTTLAQFRDGFSLELAESATGATLSSLMRLMDQAWLRRDPVSGCYTMPELLRRYVVGQPSEAAPHEQP